MVKVLHILPTLSPLAGGPTQVAIHLVKALIDCGVQAEIVTTNDHGLDCLPVPLGQKVLYQGVPVWFFKRTLRMKEFLPSRSLAQWLWQSIPNYDILDLHYLFSFAPTIAARIAQYYQVPYTLRTMGQLAPWALKQSAWRKKLYLKGIEQYNLNHAACIHATTGAETIDIRRVIPTAQVCQLPLGVANNSGDPQASVLLHEQYKLPLSTPIVLFISRLHYKKRPDLLLQSLHEIQSQGIPFHGIFAGSGEPNYVSSLQQQASHLGLDSQIHWVGFVSGIEKQQLLQGADVFVLPSYSENFGIAVAEAMMAGLPVVVTPGVQLAEDVISAKAGFVAEDTLQSVTDSLIQLLTNPILRQQFGHNGHQFARQHYDWQGIAQKLIPCYQTIVQKHQPPLPSASG